jgi:hypothetical protein
MEFAAFAAVLGFCALIGVATGGLATRKGYDFWPWFFSGGPIGLTFLAFQPDTKDPNLSEGNRQFLREKGNRLGWKIAVVAAGLGVLRMLMGSG